MYTYWKMEARWLIPVLTVVVAGFFSFFYLTNANIDAQFLRYVLLIALIPAFYNTSSLTGIKVYPPDLLIGAMCSSMFVSGVVHEGSVSVLVKPLFYLTLYTTFRCYSLQVRPAGYLIDVILFGAFFYLLFLLYLASLNGSYIFFITGAFVNTGENAIFFSIILPISVTRIDLKRSQYRSWVAILVTLTSLVIVLLSFSRTAWMVLLAMSIILLLHLSRKYGKQAAFLMCNRKMILLVFLIAVPLLLSSIYRMKPHSASGRILIYKVCTGALVANPIAGVGYGKFESSYNNYQSDYIKNNPKEPLRYLADNTYSAFNEFLELSVELGIMGVLMAVMSLWYFFSWGMRFLKNRNGIPVEYFVLVAIFIATLFSHPFSSPVIQSIGLLCVATLVSQDAAIRRPLFFIAFFLPVKIALQAISFLVVFATCGWVAVSWKAVDDWEKAKSFALLGDQRSAIVYFEKAYRVLHRDGRFLYNYGAELSLMNDYAKSNEVLFRAGRYYSSSSLYIFIGDNFLAMKDYDNAALAYQHAAAMVPSKFVPKYKQLKLYYNTGNIKHAKVVAMEILSQPVKVPSSMVRQIKNEALLVFHENTSIVK